MDGGHQPDGYHRCLQGGPMNNQESRKPGTRTWILLLAVLIPVLLLLLLGGSFVQDAILVPIEYLIWLTGLAIKVVPQYVFWAILCTLVLLLGLRGLLSGNAQSQLEVKEEPGRTRSERVAFWALQIRMRSRGNYSKLRFAEFFCKLILDILTYSGQINRESYEEALKAGILDVPPEIQGFLKTRLTPLYELRSPGFFTGIFRSIRSLLFSLGNRSGQKQGERQIPSIRNAPAAGQPPATNVSPNQDLETAIAYLEHELEVNSNHHEN